jgi:hypothetical protein
MAASPVLEECTICTKDHARPDGVDDRHQRPGVSHVQHGRCGTLPDICQRRLPCLHDVGRRCL